MKKKTKAILGVAFIGYFLMMATIFIGRVIINSKHYSNTWDKLYAGLDESMFGLSALYVVVWFFIFLGMVYVPRFFRWVDKNS